MDGREGLSPRWQRDNRILAAIGVGLGVSLALLYALLLRARELSPTALTNRVLLFVLFYFVVLLILVLLFVLGRNAVHLLVDARRGVFGSRFRVRIVLTHVGLALLPIALLLLPVTGLLQRSVEFWFEPPVAETVRSGRAVSDLVREREAERERRTTARLSAALAGAPRSEEQATALLSEARSASALDLVEWHPYGRAGAEPLAVSSPRWPVREVGGIGAEWAASRGWSWNTLRPPRTRGASKSKTSPFSTSSSASPRTSARKRSIIATSSPSGDAAAWR